jgi:CDP-diacylglycerol--glycerol-3-phosphate 3-phosphatidyltransferase
MAAGDSARDPAAVPALDARSTAPSPSSAVAGTTVPVPAGLVNIANVLTMVRILLVPVFGWFLLAHPHHTGFRIAAVVVFAVASFTDRLDGQLARERGLVTEFGTMADPLADKALMGMALIGLSLLGELPWWVTVVILARELGITLLRFWVIRHGVIPASRGGKAKTMTQAVAIGLYLLPLPDGIHWIAQVVMAVALVLTVVTGVDYVLSAMRRARERSRAQQ